MHIWLVAKFGSRGPLVHTSPDSGLNTASEAVGDYAGSRFAAVNSTPTRQPVPKRSKAQQAAAAIKLEAETEAKEDAEEALVAVKNEGGEEDEGI
ncbi:hypothetical protein Sste5346_000275 [Sporothrix stenoceras]|uniref:Uncharacterized protein n=1 Tax=Sporothrix stenoceras TaxID=5173 RepID=A0ABR3ZSJ5_9PEZI